MYFYAVFMGIGRKNRGSKKPRHGGKGNKGSASEDVQLQNQSLHGGSRGTRV